MIQKFGHRAPTEYHVMSCVPNNDNAEKHYCTMLRGCFFLTKRFGLWVAGKDELSRTSTRSDCALIFDISDFISSH